MGKSHRVEPLKDCTILTHFLTQLPDWRLYPALPVGGAVPYVIDIRMDGVIPVGLHWGLFGIRPREQDAITAV